MITITTKERIERIVTRKVDLLLNDNQRRREIAMEYLITLSTGNLNSFMKAVDLRKQSDKLLERLDEKDPDVDKASQEVGELLQETN